MMLSKEKLVATIEQSAKEWLHDKQLPVCYIDVNSGSCDEFAYSVKEKLGNDSSIKIVHTGTFLQENGLESYGTQNYSNHVWILFEGEHFDIECIDGVSDFQLLPYFKREREAKRLGMNSIEFEDLILGNPSKYKNYLCYRLVE